MKLEAISRCVALSLVAAVVATTVMGCAGRREKAGPARDSSVGHRWDRPAGEQTTDQAAHEQLDEDGEKDAAPAPRTTRTRGLGTAPAGMARGVLYYPTGDPATSGLRVVTMMPSELEVGQEFEYTIQATNLLDIPLENVSVTDAPSENFAIQSASPDEYERSGGNWIWYIGQMGSGATEEVTVRAVASAADSIRVCSQASYDTTVCIAANVVAPELQIAKAVTEEATPCDEIELRYTVTNSGTGTVRDARVEDDLPNGLTTAAGNSSVSFGVDPLGPGESRTYRVRGKASRTGEFSSVARATAGGLSATSDAPTTVVNQAVLGIEVDCVGTRYLGAPASFTVTVENTGDAPALDTRLTAPVPSGSQYVDATAGGMLSGSNIVWELGTIAPGASRSATFRVNPISIGSVNATATASATCASDVSDSCSTEVRGVPAVLLEVIDQTDPVLVGEQTTYLIVVTNQGSATDRNIDVEATIPPGSTFISATGPGGTTATANDEGMIDFPNLGSLAPKEKAEWRVTVRADQIGDVRFRCSMRTAELDTEAERVTETEATRFYSFDD